MFVHALVALGLTLSICGLSVDRVSIDLQDRILAAKHGVTGVPAGAELLSRTSRKYDERTVRLESSRTKTWKRCTGDSNGMIVLN